MCYKYLWDNLVKNNFSFDQFFHHFNLNRWYILSGDVKKHIFSLGFDVKVMYSVYWKIIRSFLCSSAMFKTYGIISNWHYLNYNVHHLFFITALAVLLKFFYWISGTLRYTLNLYVWMFCAHSWQTTYITWQSIRTCLFLEFLMWCCLHDT